MGTSAPRAGDTGPARGGTARSPARPGRAAAVPGLVLAALLAGAALAVNRAVPLLSALLVAIVLGMLVRNLGLVPRAAEPGIKVTARTVLRLGVVLLGLRLSVPQVLELGWGVVAVIVATVAATFVATLVLGRAMGVGRPTRLLVATGTAVCGASAVAAMSAVLPRGGDGAVDGPDSEDVDEAAATAVATVTIFGTLALLGLPVLVGVLGMGQHDAGVWVGASVHEVGQVVAGAGLVGAGALDVAVLTKLGRVVLLAPLVTLVGLAQSRRRQRDRAARATAAEVDDVLSGRPVDHAAAGRPPLVPMFVLAFLVLVMIRSTLPVPAPVVAGADVVATLLLTAAMAAVGAGVNLRSLVRSGGGALALGAMATVVSVAVGLVGVLVIV